MRIKRINHDGERTRFNDEFHGAIIESNEIRPQVKLDPSRFSGGQADFFECLELPDRTGDARVVIAEVQLHDFLTLPLPGIRDIDAHCQPIFRSDVQRTDSQMGVLEPGIT